jgi:uncharacterized protein HemY
MFMVAGDYKRAVQLTDKVKTKYPLLDAVCKLLGRYKLDMTDQKALFELIENSSGRNRVVMRLYQKKYDTTTVAALQALPQEDALTDYLKVQRLCRQFDGAAKMAREDFNREDDPALLMPDDEIIPAATPEEIKAVQDAMKVLQEDIQLYVDLGMISDAEKLQKELEAQKKTLANMEKGEETVIQKPCTVYDAAYVYLKRCFERDPKYVDTARGDLDIDEELLNDVLGIKPKKK